jgi:ABC-type phosphate transport system substrate-binding protein
MAPALRMSRLASPASIHLHIVFPMFLVRIFARPLLALCLALPFVGVIRAQTIRVVGSDLYAAHLQVPLERYLAALGVRAEFALSGSRPAVEALAAGKADLALLLLAADDLPPPAEFKLFTIGYHSAVFAVRADLPLAQLTYPQAAGIYGQTEANSHLRWADLGLKDQWGSRAIQPFAASRRTGVGLDLFRYTVMKDPALRANVVVLDDATEAARRVRDEDNGSGIVLLSAPPATELGLKVLLVAKSDREVAYPPTPDNLHSGDYPLRFPVQLAFRPADAKRLAPVLRYLLSEELAQAWQAAGVSPLPSQARNQLVFTLEAL